MTTSDATEQIDILTDHFGAEMAADIRRGYANKFEIHAASGYSSALLMAFTRKRENGKGFDLRIYGRNPDGPGYTLVAENTVRFLWTATAVIEKTLKPLLGKDVTFKILEHGARVSDEALAKANSQAPLAGLLR